MNWMEELQEELSEVSEETPPPDEPQSELTQKLSTQKTVSLDKNAFVSVNNFLSAYCVESQGAEVAGAKFYADYQAFCHSCQLKAVNGTAFSVRVMNVYRNCDVQRDEVMRDGVRVEIYRGLTLKSTTQSVEPTSEPSTQNVRDFLSDVEIELSKAADEVKAPELPKAVATARSDWRFTDSFEVQRRLAMGWRLIGERCVTDGEYFYSEPVGWVWEEKPTRCGHE